MASANSNQHIGRTQEDAVFDADKALITDAANTAPDPQITRAEQLADWIAGARRARVSLGWEA
jgi:hypothetical protein